MSSERFAPLASAAVIVSTLALSACDGSVRREGPPEVGFEIVRVDTAHNRRWVLREDALTVYDALNRRRLRRIVLPDWVLAGPPYGCPPDLVLDAKGAAFVSSNVQPVLWRVDPQGFRPTRMDIALDADTDKDVGFTGFSLASDGALIATGATFPSLWRIDLASGRATKLASFPAAPAACSVAALVDRGFGGGL